MHNTLQSLTFLETFISESESLTTSQVSFEQGGTMFVDPIKTIETGQIRRHIRVSEDFVLLESVLHGFKRKFIDSLTILTNTGKLVKKVYRIRNEEYNTDRPYSNQVTQILREYLFLSDKDNKVLETNITQLYTPGFQKSIFNKIQNRRITGKLVETYGGSLRQSGASTRKIDRLVQDLFTKGKAFVYESRDVKQAFTNFFIDRFQRRMQSEHKHVQYDIERTTVDGIYCGLVTLK